MNTKKVIAFVAFFIVFLVASSLAFSSELANSAELVYASSETLNNVPEKLPLWSYEATKKVNSVKVSDDGRYIVAGTDESYVYLFSTDDNKPLDAFNMGGSVSIVESSFNGSYIAAATGNVVKAFRNDGISLDHLWSFANSPGNEGGIYSLSFCSDGKFLAVGTWGKSGYYTSSRAYTYVYFFNVTSGEKWSHQINDIPGRYQYDYVSVEISSNGEYIVAGSTWNHKAYLFNQTNLMFTYLTEGTLGTVSTSKNGKYFIVGGHNKLYFFKKEVETPMWTKAFGSSIFKAEISDERTDIAVATSYGIYLLDSDSNILWSHRIEDISLMDMTGNGQHITLSTANYVYFFSSEENVFPSWLANTGDAVSSIATSDTGKFVGVASGFKIVLFDNNYDADLVPIVISFSTETPSEDETITIFVKIKNSGNLSSVSTTMKLYDGDLWVDELDISGITPNSTVQRSINCILTPGGNHVIKALVDPSNEVYESNENNNMCIENITVTSYSSNLYENLTITGQTNALSLSDDSYFIVAGGKDGYLYFFIRNKMSRLWSDNLSSLVEHVKISGNGFYTATSHGNFLDIFSRCGRRLWSFANSPGNEGGIYSLSFCSDGKFLAVGTWGKSGYYTSSRAYTYVYFFNVTSGEKWSHQINDIPGRYQYDYVSVEISSNGEYIVAGSTWNHKAYLFNQGGLVFSYDTGADINSVSISGDGTYFVAGGNKVYYWEKQVEVPKWNKKLGADISRIIISEDGEYIVATSGSELYLLSGSNGDIIWNYTFSEAVEAGFSTNGDKIVAVFGNTAYVFSILIDGNPATEIHDPIRTIQLEQTISCFAVSKDGSYVLLGSGTNIYIFLFEKFPTFLTDPSSTVTYSHDAYISTRLTDEKGEPISNADISFNLYYGGWNSIGSNTTDADGYSSIVYTANLPAGIHPLEVSYNGSMYYAARSFIGNLTIYKEPTSISLTKALIITNYSDSVVISSTLQDDESNPIEGVLVHIQLYVEGEWVTIGQNTTDNLGHTSLLYTLYLLPTDYPLAVLFEGDDCYEDCRDEGTLTIEKEVTLLSDPSTSALYNDSAVAETQLTDDERQPIEGANITFWIYANESWSFIDSDLTNATGYATISFLANFQPKTYELEARYAGNEFYYNIEAEGTLHIFSRVIIDVSLVSRDRADVNSFQTIFFHAKWEHNSSSINNGAVYINGTERFTNSTGWAKLDVISSLVGVQTWTVTAVDCYGATVFSQTCKSPSIIWDKVSVTLTADDQRIDIGTNASIIVSAFYAYDGGSFTDSIVLNDTSFISASIEKKTYRVAQIVDQKYGLTAFSSNTVSVIWDRVDVTLAVDNQRIDVGTNASISINAIYAYGGERFEGSIVLNDTSFTSPLICKKSFCVDHITDDAYGLIAFSSNAISVIWDRVDIKLIVDDERIDVGENATIAKEAIYVYDGKPFEGIMILNDTLVSSLPCKKTYRVKEIIDEKYELSAFSSNTVSIIWDRINVTLTVSNQRVEVGKNITVIVEAVCVYDGKPLNGLVVLNDTSFTSDSVRKRTYCVSQVVDNMHNLTTFSSNTVSVVWDRIDVQHGISWTTPGTVEIIVTLHYSYDGTPVDDAEVFLGGVEAINIGNGQYVHRMPRWDLSVKTDLEIRKTLFGTLNLTVEGFVLLNILTLIVLPLTLGGSSAAYLVSWWRKRKILRSTLLRRRVKDEIVQMKNRKGMIDIADFSKKCKIDKNALIKLIESLRIKGVYFSKNKERIFSKEWLRNELKRKLK